MIISLLLLFVVIGAFAVIYLIFYTTRQHLHDRKDSNDLRSFYAEKFNAEDYEPAFKVSICTGERTAGFIQKDSGIFHDCMLIHSQKDISEFCLTYGVDEYKIKTIY